MPGDKPPRAHPVRTSLFDRGWEDTGTTQVDAEAREDTGRTEVDAELPEDTGTTEVDAEIPEDTTQVKAPRPPRASATDVDDLLDELRPEDTYATLRRADVLPGLGGPPEVTASPLGGPAPFRVGPPSEPPGASPQAQRPLPPPSVPPPAASPVAPDQQPPTAVEPPPLVASAAARIAEAPPHSAASPDMPEPLSSPEAAGPAIDAALSRRVSFAGFSAQVGPVFVSAMVVLMLAVGAIGAAIGFGLGRSAARHRAPAAQSSAGPAASSASAAPAPTPTPTPTLSETPAPVGSTTLDRAAAGDPAALAEIEARPAAARTIDEAVAIVAGRAATKVNALEALGKKLKQDPKKLDDIKVDHQLIEFARDERTGWRALHIIAKLQTARSADLLYEIWIGTARHTANTELAEALLKTKAVSSHASPALAAALDLRSAKTCADVKKLLPKVQANGDRRSLYMLGKLRHHRGCGAHKRHDCYRCLRHSHAITDAIKAARKRAAPKL